MALATQAPIASQQEILFRVEMSNLETGLAVCLAMSVWTLAMPTRVGTTVAVTLMSRDVQTPM